MYVLDYCNCIKKYRLSIKILDKENTVVLYSISYLLLLIHYCVNSILIVEIVNMKQYIYIVQAVWQFNLYVLFSIKMNSNFSNSCQNM